VSNKAQAVLLLLAAIAVVVSWYFEPDGDS
jgi:hypothetical protein